MIDTDRNTLVHNLFSKTLAEKMCKIRGPMCGSPSEEEAILAGLEFNILASHRKVNGFVRTVYTVTIEGSFSDVLAFANRYKGWEWTWDTRN